MRRSINAFSLTPRAAEELDWLVAEVQKKGPSPTLVPFLESNVPSPSTKGEEAKPEEMDSYSLKQSDYRNLYDSLPQPQPYRVGPRLFEPMPPPTLFNWPLLVDLSRKMERDPVRRAAAFKHVRKLQTANRRELHKYETALKRRAKKPSVIQAAASKVPFVVNRSRIVEAIILLVVTGQKERVLQVVADAQGSSPENARKGGDKLSQSSRRKALTV